MIYHIELDIDFKRNTEKGLYIGIEGIDGSGKSTQVKKLQEYFFKKEKKVIITSEPRNDMQTGRLIRDILNKSVKIPPVALQYIFSADRVVNHETVVKPALKKGKIVLSHRVFWSAVPYGVMDKENGVYDFSRSNQIMIAQGLLSMYHQFTIPDITFYLRVRPEIAVTRLEAMKKQKEIYEKKESLEKIVKGYELLLQEFPNEFVVMDAEKSEEDVTADILTYMQSHGKI